MKNFNLEEYLKNPNLKVVARDGRPVEILKTDYENCAMIVLYDNDTIGLVSHNGMLRKSLLGDCGTGLCENPGDIFFLDEKEEHLSVFEKQVRDIISNHLHIEVDVNSLKEISNEFLEMMQSEWSNGWNSAQKDLIKNMPTLEKIEKVYDPTIPLLYTDLCTSKTYVELDGYRICVNDLFNKLPKEE